MLHIYSVFNLTSGNTLNVMEHLSFILIKTLDLFPRDAVNLV